MKKLQKTLTFYPYEYKVLEEYLCDMSKKGYRLVSLKGDLFYAIATFEEYEGSYIQYVCDFTASNGFFQEDSDETIAYRSFIEEYGYTYISSFHGVLIFSSDEPIRFEIREHHADNKKQLRKTTLYYFLSYIFIGLMYMLVLNIFTTTIADFASSNLGIVYYIFTRILLVPYIWMMLQPLLYLFGITLKTDIATINRRTTLLSFTLALWAFSFFQKDSSIDSLLEMFMVIVIGIVLLHTLWNWMKEKAIAKRAIYFGVSTIALSVLLLVYVQHLQDTYIKTDEVPMMLNKEDVFITSSQTPSSEYHSSYLMSEIDMFYDPGEYYNIQYVKDSPISSYLTRRLIYNARMMDVEERDGYTVYNRFFDVAIEHNHYILSISHDSYEKMSIQDIKKLFTQIQQEML